MRIGSTEKQFSQREFHNLQVDSVKYFIIGAIKDVYLLFRILQNYCQNVKFQRSQ